MQFRFAQSDEIPELARLVAHSFVGRPNEFWNEQLRDPPHGGGPETLLVGHSADQPIAALQLHRLSQWIAGSKLPMAGVGTVTVSPIHRQKGVAAQLMEQALRAAVDRGDVASALYPFRISFYQKLGYGLAGTALQYQVPPAALPPSDERKRVGLLETDAQRAAAASLYSEWVRTQNGQLERDGKVWKSLTTVQDVALAGYRGPGGKLEGYALVAYRADLPFDQRFLEVNELVWMGDAAKFALLGWLASLGDQWQRIVLRGLPSHNLGELIREPRLPSGSAPSWSLWKPSATQMIGPMFRLLDLQAAWRLRGATSEIAVGLHVTDPQIEENSGDWQLRLGRDGGELSRGNSADVTLRLDISALSRLYIGALKPSVALEAGLLECDRPERLAALDEALALPEPWMFDRF